MTPKPFHEVIHGLCGHKVIPLDAGNARDARLLATLDGCLREVLLRLGREPIVSKRVNEVGNKIEPYFMDAVNTQAGYKAEVPGGKSAGYPDLLVTEDGEPERYTYVECKTYNAESVNSGFRSFFLSGSESFKVQHDARHLVAGFQIINIGGERYRATGFKLVDAYNLPCSLKEEWNPSNRHLYSLPMLAEHQEES